MPSIEWSDSLSVGVEEIDMQHRKIFELIEVLERAIRTGERTLEDIISQLLDYSTYHFDTEENYFRKFVIPGQVAHRREHDFFVEKVTSYKSRIESGEKGLSVEIYDFLTGWISQHISGMDQRYAPFLRHHLLNIAS